MRISFVNHSLREGNGAERSTVTHGASKPIATDGAGADGSAEGSSSQRFCCHSFIPGM